MHDHNAAYRDLLEAVAYGAADDPTITAHDRLKAAQELDRMNRTGRDIVREMTAEVMDMSTEELDREVAAFMEPLAGERPGGVDEAEVQRRINRAIAAERKKAREEAARKADEEADPAPSTDAPVIPLHPAPAPAPAPRQGAVTARPETDSMGHPIPPGISRETADRAWGPSWRERRARDNYLRGRSPDGRRGI